MLHIFVSFFFSNLQLLASGRPLLLLPSLFAVTSYQNGQQPPPAFHNAAAYVPAKK